MKCSNWQALYSNGEHQTLFRSVETTLRQLIRHSSPYFATNATAEMMDEWRPLMCPHDVTTNKAVVYFEMFLPTFNKKDQRDSSFDLWFDELMAFWEACDNSPMWEGV